MEFNLETLQLEELKALKEQIEREIARKQVERVSQLTVELRSMAERLGVPIDAFIARLTNNRASRRGRPVGSGAGVKVPIRYRHPTDPTKGWTGRGLAPRWLKEWEASGHSREELLVG